MTSVAAACDHCALPVGVGRVERTRGETRLAFCCLGCSIAFRLGGDVRREGGSESASYLARIGLGAVFTMAVMLVQWVVYLDPAAAADPSYARYAPWVQWGACTPVMLILGVPYLWNAAAQLRRGRIGADVLIGIALLAGYAVSAITVLRGQVEPLYFDTVAALATLVTVGRFIEAAAKRRATAGLRAFLSDADRPARRTASLNASPEDDELIDAGQLAVGDLVRVRPGERVPSDGVIEQGRAFLDTAALTGEPTPRTVEPGAEVMAPSIPMDGPLWVRITKVGSDTLLARVAAVLAKARTVRAPAEVLADRVSRVFVPAVLMLAVGVLVFDVRSGAAVDAAVMHALAVLVVACPCALGIATPLAVTAAMGRLAERGILVRTGRALGALPDLKALVFDKTGTLTQGTPTLQSIEALSLSQDELLALTAAAERESEHPIGVGVREAARAQGLDERPARDWRVYPGRGVEAHVEHNGAMVLVRVGSARWLDQPDQPNAIAVVVDGTLAGRLHTDDPLRPGAAGALATLRDMRVEVHIASGDSQANAERIAAQLGLPRDVVHGGLLPDEKVQAVVALRAQIDGPLGFVGDGLNDAPALAAADLGVAVGSGTDLARETADVSLLGDDLQRLPGLLRAATATRRAVKWNLFWAFGYNIAAVAWAVWFGLPPAVAALAMVCSSLFVIGNSVRLRRSLPALLLGTTDPIGSQAPAR